MSLKLLGGHKSVEEVPRGETIITMNFFRYATIGQPSPLRFATLCWNDSVALHTANKTKFKRLLL